MAIGALAIVIVAGGIPFGGGISLGSHAAAQGRDGNLDRTASAAFDAGVAHFAERHYAEALDAFRGAYRQSPRAAVLVNIANCHRALGHPVEAAVHFERYLAETADTLDADTRETVELALADARAQIATLRIVTSEVGRVFVDGDARSATPMLAPIFLDPGDHVLELRVADGRTISRRIQLAPGEARRLPIGPRSTPGHEGAADAPDAAAAAGTSIAPAAAPADPFDRPAGTSGESDALATLAVTAPEDGVPTSDPGLHVPWPAWVSGGTTVVAIGLGTAFGLTAMSQREELGAMAQRAGGMAADDPRLATLRRDAGALQDAERSNATLADIMFVGAILAAGATVYFLFFDDLFDDPSSPEDDQAQAAVEVARGVRQPSIALSPFGLSGRF